LFSIDANIPLCPGKTYNVVLLTRRMQAGSACMDPEDRDNIAFAVGDLVTYQGGQVGTFPWNITPQNFDDATINDPGDSGNTLEGETFDNNWAAAVVTITTPGDPLWDFQVDIAVDDACYGMFSETFDEDEMSIPPATPYVAGTPGSCPDDGTPASSTNITEDFGGAAATAICGAMVTTTYTSDNSCGAGFGSNTFIVTDASTVLSSNLGSSVLIDGMAVVDDNGDGRFETINGLSATGIACQDGMIDLTFENSNCAAEDGFIEVNVTYQVDVQYPTSEFADIPRVNCSDMCGPDILT